MVPAHKPGRIARVERIPLASAIDFPYFNGSLAVFTRYHGDKDSALIVEPVESFSNPCYRAGFFRHLDQILREGRRGSSVRDIAVLGSQHIFEGQNRRVADARDQTLGYLGRNVDSTLINDFVEADGNVYAVAADGNHDLLLTSSPEQRVANLQRVVEGFYHQPLVSAAK